MSCFIKRILQFKEAISYSIIYISDKMQKDMTSSCKYSWSGDGICWSCWSSYTEYLRITKNIETDYYLRILFDFELGEVKINNVATLCYNISLDNSNIFLKNFCEEPNLLQPYNNLDCALQLQQQLADSVICMLGIPIYYFKVVPNVETADYTFKEFVLHNVKSVKQIKLMIPDGQMPSSNYKMTDFDFDWETDWETEISKTQFATAFGDKEIPDERDFIYIPMMKRMWQVNSAYDEKNEGLMWQSTTWKLSLVKYSETTNISTDNFDNIIDSLIINKYEDKLGPLEQAEQERETGSSPLSSPNFASNNLYNIFTKDAVRLRVTDDIKVLDKFTCHKNNITSRNIYNLSNDSIIEYQKNICGDEGTIMFIFETDNLSEIKKPILIFGNINIFIYNKDGKPVITSKNIEVELEPHKVYMYICRWSNGLYMVNESIYKQIYREDVPKYYLKPEMKWFDYEHPICDKISDIDGSYIYNKKSPCYLNGPINITNIKYYNRFLNDDDKYKESIKYVTNDNRCIINDLARPISVGNGYSVK